MIRTFQQRIPIFRRESGFTLIETLIVIGLVAMIMSLVIPNLGLALKVNLNNSSRELATTIRTTYDEAVLKGQIYRMAFDIEHSQYWVESGDRKFLMKTHEQEEDERRLNERRNDEEKEKHKEAFALAQSVTKKKLSLPKGSSFQRS